MNRDPESLGFEAVYLRELNLGLQALLGTISDAAAEVAGVPVALLALVLAPPSPAAVDAVTARASAALDRLAAIQSQVIELGELVGGRILVLNREAGLDEAPDD